MNAQLIQGLGLLMLAYAAVFLAAGDYHFFGLPSVRVDLLPVLMVYAGLNAGWIACSAVALVAGLGFDALSANPLAISVMPLFLVAFGLKWQRELILREDAYAQFVLGGLASAAVPLAVVLLLLAIGQKPLLGWGLIPIWLVKSLVAAVCAPLIFWFFNKLNRAFSYPLMAETSFRPDREIKRGRA